MTDTTNLGLPNIEAAQAQKHVTHNDALRMLDTLVQLAVADRDLSTPPGSPADGQRWIVKATGTDAWAGHDNAIAAWQDGAWQFYAPQVGWRAYVADEGVLLAWDGSAWGDVSTANSTGVFYADRNGTNQTGTAGTNNKLQANNETVDERGWYDNGTNYRYQPTEPGYYYIFGSIRAASGTAGESPQALIFKNGSQVAAGFYCATGLSGNIISNVTTIVALNGATDYVEFFGYLPAGNTTISGNRIGTFWSGYKIADL